MLVFRDLEKKENGKCLIYYGTEEVPAYLLFKGKVPA